MTERRVWEDGNTFATLSISTVLSPMLRGLCGDEPNAVPEKEGFILSHVRGRHEHDRMMYG